MTFADPPLTIDVIEDGLCLHARCASSELIQAWQAAPGDQTAVHRLTSAPGLRLTISRLRLSDVDAIADAVAAAVGPTGSGARY